MSHLTHETSALRQQRDFSLGSLKVVWARRKVTE